MESASASYAVDSVVEEREDNGDGLSVGLQVKSPRLGLLTRE